MARRQRIDSATAAVAVMAKAAQTLVPPGHVPLTEADLPFWENVIGEKAKSEWTAHDLEIAALLARSLRRLEAEEGTLDGEDGVLVSAGGSPMANPRLRIIADLHARVIKYRQTLGIHSRGKGGEARDVEKRRSQAREIEDGNPMSDDLIARPTVQ